MKKTFDFSLIDEFNKKTTEEINKMEPINILVAGKTGVGKSTLINHLFRERLAQTGIGKPITQHIQKITKEGMPINLYDTRGLELKPEVQTQLENEIKDTLAELTANNDRMDMVYYCISANTSRIEENEIQFIERLAHKLPVMLVLTQSLCDVTQDFKDYLVNLSLPVNAVIDVLAADFIINENVTIPAYGLDKLIARTFEIISEDRHGAFNNAQQVDIERKITAAKRWARRYMGTTFGVGFTPIPFADATVLVPMQIGMLAHITAIFGVSVDRATLLSLLGGVVGTGSATYVGRLIVSNLVKFVPGVGTSFGGVISGATAAIVTSALASSYIEVLAIIATQETKGLPFDVKYLKKVLQLRLKERLGKTKDDTNVKEIIEKNLSMDNTQSKSLLKKWFK